MHLVPTYLRNYIRKKLCFTFTTNTPIHFVSPRQEITLYGGKGEKYKKMWKQFNYL